jgi:hypothetical protein
MSASALRNGLSLVSVLLLSGCLNPKMYVDPALPVVRAEEFRPATPVGPVQVIFEFRTEGSPNPTATDEVRPTVIGAIGKTGAFTRISDEPVPEGRTLTIVIDNVRLDGAGWARAFAAGFTFGLAGTTLTDGYVCTATYRGQGGRTNSKTVKHAIHTTLGNAAGPPGIAPMQPGEAVTQVMEQLTVSALRALSRDGL